MRGVLFAAIVLGGCAQSDGAVDGVDAPDPDPEIDSQPACTPQTTQLLVNPELDMSPQGMGWTDQVIQVGYPLITPRDGRPEHTAPYKVWLGGFAGSSLTDVLHQDVAIPPMTTKLVLSGVHDVRTVEDPGETTVLDFATVALTEMDNTPIETILSLSNLTPKTGWTPFEFTFARDLSGQTVRLRFTSTNNADFVSSFYFDTLALTATHGCP